MKLFALDCDSFKLAVSVFNNTKLIKTFIVDSDRKLDSDKRGTILYNKFCIILDKEKPNILVTEKSLYSNNFVSSRTITEIIGFVKLACNQRDIPYYMVYVPSWKKYITGNGKSTKDEIRASIIKIYPELTDSIQDLCDSTSIGLYYLNNIDKIKKAK